LNPVAAPNDPALHHATEPAALSAQFLLKSLADFVHPRARIARQRYLKQAAPNTQMLACFQTSKIQSASRDVLLHSAGRDTHLLQGLHVNQCHLPLAARSAVDTSLESPILHRLRLLDFLHRKSVNEAKKYVRYFRHCEPQQLR